MILVARVALLDTGRCTMEVRAEQNLLSSQAYEWKI